MAMNPMSIIQTMLNQLKMKNPKEFQTINALMQNNGNPEIMIQQMFKNSTTEQRQNILNQAKNYGVPTEILAKLQNIK